MQHQRLRPSDSESGNHDDSAFLGHPGLRQGRGGCMNGNALEMRMRGVTPSFRLIPLRT